MPLIVIAGLYPMTPDYWKSKIKNYKSKIVMPMEKEKE